MSTDLLPFFVVDPLQAAQFRDATRGRLETIDPVLIRGGKYAGKYAIPTRVERLEAHRDLAPAFAVMERVALDVAVAFPPDEEG